MHNREGDMRELTWLHSALLHVCGEGGGQCLERLQVSASGVFSNHLYPIFLIQGLSLNLDWVCWLTNELQWFTLTTSPSPSLGYWCIIPDIFMLMMGIKLSSPCLPQALYSRSHFPSLHFSIKCNKKQNFLTLRILSFDFKIRSVCKVKQNYWLEIGWWGTKLDFLKFLLSF